MDTWLIDLAMRQLAERQHGVMSRAQARALGANREMIRRRLQSRAWEALTSQVLRLVGTAATFQQRCMAAVLDSGPSAAASHRTAAALWRLPGFTPDELEVARLHHNRTTRSSQLALVHRTCALPEHHLAVVEGITVTSVARTVFDLAGVLHPKRAERALDNALARDLTSISGLVRVTDELAKRGREGSSLMRQLLAERGVSYVPPESGVEGRFLGLLGEAGIEVPERQVDLGGEGWIGRVDFLYRKQKLVIEIDSSIHHSTALDRAADQRRDEQLRAAGFTVCRISADDVWHRPAAVVARIRAALRSAA